MVYGVIRVNALNVFPYAACLLSIALYTVNVLQLFCSAEADVSPLLSFSSYQLPSGTLLVIIC